MDCSLQVSAPRHPGAVVLHLGEFELTTSIIGDSPDAQFNMSVPALAFLALDDLSEVIEADSGSANGIALWKVRTTKSRLINVLLSFRKEASF